MSQPRLSAVTLELLRQCGIGQPPVELEPLMRHFQARVVESSHLADSALLSGPSGWTIKVNSALRPERKIFRIAHELGHIWWSDPARHGGDPTLGGKLEKLCSRFASLLLLPEQWLAGDAPAADFDLFALKKIYGNVSHEVLATRLCELASLVVTIFDNGKLYRRFGSTGLGFPNSPQKPEVEVFEAVDLFGSFQEGQGAVSWGGVQRKVRVRGYPVFSGSFRRIILVTGQGGDGRLAAECTELEQDMPYPFPEY